MDTLRADRLEAYGGDGLTPNLDTFAREAIVFEHASAPSNMTVLSHAAAFTGRYVSEVGQVDHGFTLGPTPPTLAEVLALYGYETAAFVAGGDLDPVYALDRGFGTYVSVEDGGSLYHTAPAALAWLEDRSGADPLFLFVHGYDAHSRYLKPTPFGYSRTPPGPPGVGRESGRTTGQPRWFDGVAYDRQTLREVLDITSFRPRGPEAREAMRARGLAAGMPTYGEEDITHMAALYDGGVAYGDAWFGLLMAGLEEQGVLDEAWVVVISDHGEELGEDGIFGHVMALSEAVVRVPLMFRPPGGATGRRVEEPVGLIDLLPTLVELAGARPPAELAGASLVPTLGGGQAPRDRVLFAEGVTSQRAAVDGRGGLVLSGLPWSTPDLGELVRGARLDGPAFSAWPGTPPEAQRELQAALADWREGLATVQVGAAPLDEERLRSLRERGYWDADR